MSNVTITRRQIQKQMVMLSDKVAAVRNILDLCGRRFGQVMYDEVANQCVTAIRVAQDAWTCLAITGALEPDKRASEFAKFQDRSDDFDKRRKALNLSLAEAQKRSRM